MTDFMVEKDIDISGFYLIEGMPGIGLVAKISSDYIVDKLTMDKYAEVYSDDIPSVAIFNQKDSQLKSSVRIFVDEENQILVLKSDTPISGDSNEFITSLVEWMKRNDLKPIFQAGLPFEVEPNEENYLFNVKNGSIDGSSNLKLPEPPIDGGIVGPTGSLLEKTLEMNLDSLGLVVESDPDFPDPEASRVIIEKGIKPVTGIDIDTSELESKGKEIKQKKKELIDKIQEIWDEKATEAYPREMYK